MTEDQGRNLSREQLYNEIWEISATGVAKKYDVPYNDLLKLCKETDIPVPPSGYWTKLKFGKLVTKMPLPESLISEVMLSANSIQKRAKRSSAFSTVSKVKAEAHQIENADIEVKDVKPDGELEKPFVPIVPQEDQLTFRTVSGECNIYNREKLYKEVWEKPVVEVAIQYGVSDRMIHKVCESLDVPVPPRGYWSRLRAGEKIKKTPLPVANGVIEIVGSKTFEVVKKTEELPQPLAFLTESERQKVLLAAQHIQMSPENTQLHKKIIAYKSVVKEWNKKDLKPEGAQRISKNYSNRPPFLAGVISNETLPRVFRILDALFRQIESLGGSVNDDLSLKVRNEHVLIDVSETQDEIDHVMTRQEAREMIMYEDAKRHNKYASEPRIRKHDYVFNGRLRIWIRQNRYFRDTDKINIESRLGDMLIEFYEESEVVRIEREAQEEAVRKREEEARLREERRERYNNEIELTIALENEALDYEKACRIRAYAKAVETTHSQDGLDDETLAWIEWANKKADWFDPTVARTDELLGDREHEQSDERKELKKSRYYW